MLQSPLFNHAISFVGALGAIVTAIATFFLWRVTKILAQETARMADSSASPQVVATIEPNRWSVRHADINIDNTGNASAFDVHIQFNPTLSPDHGTLIERISVLKPGRGISTFIGEFSPIIEKTFDVTISWSREPSGSTREKITYSLDLRTYKNIGYLGERDPSVQIAQEIKKIRENSAPVMNGSRRIQVDNFGTSDRLHEERRLQRMWKKQNQGNKEE